MSGIIIPVADQQTFNVGITAGQSGSSIGYDRDFPLGSALPADKAIGNRIFIQLIYDNVLDELSLRFDTSTNPGSTWVSTMLFRNVRWLGSSATYFFNIGTGPAIWTWSNALATGGSMVNGTSYPISIYTTLPF